MSEKDIGELMKGQEILFQEVEELKKMLPEIRDTLCAVTTQLDTVPNDTHREHHDLMKEMIEKARLRTEFWRDVKLYMAKRGVWYALAVMGTMCVFIWNGDLALKIVYKLFNLKGK